MKWFAAAILLLFLGWAAYLATQRPRIWFNTHYRPVPAPAKIGRGIKLSAEQK